jgi:hypothetical protein
MTANRFRGLKREAPEESRLRPERVDGTGAFCFVASYVKIPFLFLIYVKQQWLFLVEAELLQVMEDDGESDAIKVMREEHVRPHRQAHPKPCNKHHVCLHSTCASDVTFLETH